MVPILLVLALIIAIFAVIFALQNTAMVTVTFLLWTFEQSLALVLLLSLAAGVVVGLFTLLPTTFRQKFSLSSQRKKLDALEKTLAEMKAKEEARLAAEAEKAKAASQPSTPPAGAVTTASGNGGPAVPSAGV